MYLYHTHIKNIDDCPNNQYETKQIDICYRWVYEDIDDSRNFQPPAIRQKRANHFIHKQECGKFATSFHLDKEGSIDHYKSLSSLLGIDKSRSFFGTHLAKGKIVNGDGVCSEPCNNFRHFDIHLYVNHELNSNTFTIIDEIK